MRSRPQLSAHLATTLLAAAITAAGTGCAMSGEEEEEEVIELVPSSDDKEDGARAQTFVVGPERPEATLAVQCNEWFSCDLELKVAGVDMPPDHVFWLDVILRQESTGIRCEYELATWVTDGKVGADWWDVSASVCEETPEEALHVWSSDPDERFTITVRNDWAADDLPVTLRASARWW